MTAMLVRSLTQARYAIIGALVLLCGFQMVVIGQAAEIERSHGFGPMAELIPAFLQRGLGTRAMLLATFKGTVAFGYFHPVVCMLVVVLAMYIATEPAHEVESGLVDLQLARSVPRRRLLTRSLLLAESSILGAAVLMAAGTWLGVRLFGVPAADLPSLSQRVALLVNLAATATCFVGFALLVAALSRRWVTAFTTVTLAAVVTYLIALLAIGWPAMRYVDWISPFHYYPALLILDGDAPLVRDVAILLGAGTVFTTAAYRVFERRDL